MSGMAAGRNDLCPCGSGKKFKRCCGVVKGLPISGISHRDLINRGLALLEQGQIDAAESCFRQALAHAPGDAGLFNLLGVVELHRHKFSEAARFFQQAITRSGNEAQFYNHLAHAYKGQGALPEAVKALEKAIALDPGCAEACHNLGNALSEIGQSERAVAAYRKALELRPDDAETLHELAALLLLCGRFTETEAIFRRLVLLRPQDIKALIGLGETLEAQGLSSESERVFAQVLSLQPDSSVNSIITYGKFLIQRGHFSKAESLFIQAIRELGDNSKFYYGLSGCHKFTADDLALLAKIENMANAEKVQSSELAGVFYALGKAFDDLGEYAKAFSYYKQANNWYRSRHPFDQAQRRVVVDKLLNSFGSEFIGRPGWRSKSDAPLLIVGMPRSGTTLTEQIIASHPLVHGAGELTFWGDAVRSMGGDYRVALSDEWVRKASADYLQELEKQSGNGCVYFTDKLPGNYLFIGLIHRVFPKAKIIHCQRSPMDTCLSIYFQRFPAGEHEYRHRLTDLVFVYRQYRRLMKYWRETLPPDTLLEIRYEDLIDRQEEMSRKLVEFCGLEWDDRCLEFYKTERQVKTASRWQVRQPIYKTSKERWRNYEAYIGPLLKLLDEE